MEDDLHPQKKDTRRMISLYLLLTPPALLAALALVVPLRKETALPPARRRTLAMVILLVMLGGGFGLYTLLGAPDWVTPITEERQKQATLRHDVKTLTQAARENPSDADTWRRLGAAWVEARNPAQAAEALRQAVLASGGHPDIIAEYAAALVMKNNGAVDEEALNSIAMALRLDPEQPLARQLETLWHEQQVKDAPTQE